MRTADVCPANAREAPTPKLIFLHELPLMCTARGAPACISLWVFPVCPSARLPPVLRAEPPCYGTFRQSGAFLQFSPKFNKASLSGSCLDTRCGGCMVDPKEIGLLPKPQYLQR